MFEDMKKFKGDFTSLWKLDVLPPIPRLSWWWWWVIIYIPDQQNPGRSKQLMTLWSTKETPAIRMTGHWWLPGSRMHIDDEGGLVFPGMVCSWWFDGKKMYEPLVMKECRMAAINDQHSLWPQQGSGDGAGAVIPLLQEDMSFGMNPGNDKFWMNLVSDKEAVKRGAPLNFKAELTPWSGPPSTLTYKNNIMAMNMGYDILRLQGTKCKLNVDGEEMQGTAYFQKVSVQAPTVPWFWGMLHFDDGSYLDWFLPHVSFSTSSLDSSPWRLRDAFRTPLSGTGIFHDAKRGRSENFARCEVELSKSDTDLKDDNNNPLPRFRIRLWNGRTQISIDVRAVSRAKWVFDQPTRAGMVSHLTYNEYPLEVERIAILDEQGLRSLSDYSWIHGNAEHTWGFLH